jgi:uncharacterized protein YwqG
MERQDIADLARDMGLGRHAEAIAQLARESIRLEPFDGPIDVVGTHLGGRPAVPPDFVWPMWQERPLAFIGQIRLDELGQAGRDAGLPADGSLSFFFDADGQPWGFDPADAGGARVFWFGPGERVIRDLPPDLAEWAVFTARPVRMTTVWTVPDAGAPEVEVLGSLDSEALWRVHEGLRGDAPGAPDTVHRMFGYPDVIQNEMRHECAFASSGIDVGTPSGYDHPRAEELRRQMFDWQLLLQVDSDELLGTEFGDGGRIYYWITRDAIAKGAFDRVWQILQCY